MDALPIDPLLPQLLAALRAEGQAVLQAPPGAGKTTRVPLALLPEVTGKILMLEPRRLAARGAAQRLAESLGEAPGGRVGYRMRGESVTGPQTRIEVLTEGVLTRMLQEDPGLSGVSALIFDEFHERSLQADLGLAFALEAKAALRPDLWLLVMSATLDAAPVAALMGGAPVLTAEGRSFPVETHYLPQPLATGTSLPGAMADQIATALAGLSEGSVLAFLPGEAEIRQTAALLAARALGGEIAPLYGALDMAAQRRAIAPPRPGARKVVLATAIAETSLTIEGVQVVVDSGRARRARFDPGTGMARLVTERASRAEVEQRRGRAGRLGPGTCYRLWARGEEGAMAPFAPPEITTTDLAPLALEMAVWGGGDFRFLTPPPAPALAEARALLIALGALEGEEAPRLTAHGKAMASLPLHPRLSHLLLCAGGGAEAAQLAALLAARDPLRGAPPDLLRRLALLRDKGTPPPEADRAALALIREEAARLLRLARRAPSPLAGAAPLSPAALAALAYPDRIGQRRAGTAPRWLLSGGKGAMMAPGLPLSQMDFLVATDLDGDPREARIRQAIEISESELRALFTPRPGQALPGLAIRWQQRCAWSMREGRVEALEEERLGALVLSARPWRDAPPEALAAAALEGLRREGLTLSPEAEALLHRLAFARRSGAEALPDLHAEALLSDDAALIPLLAGLRTRADLARLDTGALIAAQIGADGLAALRHHAPPVFETPLGRKIAIDYSGEMPGVTLRLQELFGLRVHPVIGPGRVPLRLTLLSPGGRPVQVTADLPGFWAKSYAEVRRDLRGRYPRHPWPEDPTAAAPTLRAKPRGT